MASGGFDEIEMEDLSNKWENYDKSELNDYFNEISEERDKLYKEHGDNENTPQDVRVKYEKYDRELELIEEERDKRENIKSSDPDSLLEVRPENKVTFASEKFIRDDIDNDFKLNIRNDRTIELINNLNVTARNNITYKYLNKLNERSAAQIVLKRNDTNLEYNSSESAKKVVSQFKKILNDIVAETKDREKTVKNMPMVDVTPDLTEIPGLTVQENRELQGVQNPNESTDPQSRIGKNGALQIQADNFQDKIDETIEERKNTDDIEKILELEERVIGLKEARDRTLNQRKLEEIREQQEEDITRLQKFKIWAKENLLGLSAIAITIAGLITTVIVGMRSAISAGGAAGSFGKSVYKFFKNLAGKLGPVLGPVVSAIGNLLFNLLKFGAKGLLWLSKNLWALVIIAVIYIYDNNFKSKRM